MVRKLFGFSQTGYDTPLMIGQYFSSKYLWVIVAATLLSRVSAIAEVQLFG